MSRLFVQGDGETFPFPQKVIFFTSGYDWEYGQLGARGIHFLKNFKIHDGQGWMNWDGSIHGWGQDASIEDLPLVEEELKLIGNKFPELSLTVYFLDDEEISSIGALRLEGGTVAPIPVFPNSFKPRTSTEMGFKESMLEGFEYLTIHSFPVGEDEEITLKSPLRLRVVEGEVFDPHLFLDSPADEEEVKEHLAFLWKAYVLHPREKLTIAAQVLQEQLNQLV